MKPWCSRIVVILMLLGCILTSLGAPETAAGGEQMVRSPQAAEALLDGDYWVLIRNVTAFDQDSRTLQGDMDILVVGRAIHKISTSPMLIFDKDLTYNFDGEGRIALSIELQGNEDPQAPPGIGLVAEGIPANVVLVEARELAELQLLMDDPDWPNPDSMATRGKIRLIIESGVVTLDTLPVKRIDQSRLDNYQPGQ